MAFKALEVEIQSESEKNRINGMWMKQQDWAEEKNNKTIYKAQKSKLKNWILISFGMIHRSLTKQNNIDFK